ncbi:MAG: SgcJ/EcaC family oxidoreductase [Chloracidobacterium sp.]|nr:SgcJ/EcaC family oxidoreductase [Chloracidobacterium sp.]MCO5332459.1 SgcJ/EcaC family oxidoreductase [Pyrinomonadaceae bacterium]
MNKAERPEDIPRLFVENWNNRRADLLAELFEEEADFVNVVGFWWEDRRSIFKAHDYGLKVIFKDSTLRSGRIKTKLLADDVAVLHVRMTLAGQTPIEKDAGIRQTVFTFVVRKRDGFWLCASAQNTDIVAGAETYIRSESGDLRPADYRKKEPS